MDKYKEEIDEYREEKIYEYADKFINLANEMAKADNSGAVGVAFRYAAARYCAFEASLHSNDLAEDMEKQQKLFVEAFEQMLRANLLDYVKIQSQK